MQKLSYYKGVLANLPILLGVCLFSFLEGIILVGKDFAFLGESLYWEKKKFFPILTLTLLITKKLQWQIDIFLFFMCLIAKT